MFRIALASVVIASVAASRVGDHAESKFGRSCEDLKDIFHNRVVQLQALIDEHPDATQFGKRTEMRFMMRAFGVVRTLRRSRECAWVVDGDSNDIDTVRDIVQTLLADNPCGSEAKAELDTGRSAESGELELQSVFRAMSILNSDDCEVSATEEGRMDESIEDTLEEVSGEAEDLAQDNLDHLMSENDATGALVQTDLDERLPTFRRVMRTLGVAFLFVLLGLLCTGAIAVIAALLVGAISMFTVTLWCPMCAVNQAGMIFAFHAFYAAMAGSGVGLAVCSYSLAKQLLPGNVTLVNATITPS